MNRTVLRRQLDVAWSLADLYHLPAVTEENTFWKPAATVCTVRDGVVEMPDETVRPSAAPTVAWLLWHVTWWWTNAHRWAAGEDPVAWDEHPWAGSAAEAVSQIRALHASWITLVDETAPDAPVSGPWPDDGTFERLTAWVTFELTKNVAEIGQLVNLHAHAADVR